MIVLLTNGGNIWKGFATDYGDGFKYFAGTYFLLFILGSLFGKVMSDTGSASAISYKLIDWLGTKRVILIILLATAILTYGGVSLFVVVFTVYPIGLVLFQKAEIPKRILCAAVVAGAGTFTMTALPGTPQIQNIIPAQILGTTPMAAPVIGITASLLMFFLCLLYLNREAKIAAEKGEPFTGGPNGKASALPSADLSGLPDWKIAFLPLILVIAIIVALKGKMDPLASVAVAMTVATLVCYLLNMPKIKNPVQTLTEGLSMGVMPLINTAAIVGFGFVVQKVPAFQSFVKFALGLKFDPLISAVFATNIVAGITGSSSGGLSIFLKTMGPEYLKLGVNPEILHRISAIASGGLDTLPHCGGIITILMVMGLTHKEAYKGIFVTSVLIPIIAVIVGVIMAMAGIV
ncbi:MAG: GntP family permease [Peptococcaceae bacterium]|nr:GntP family permease [Peptococcaceae bacterium]MDH7525507.1 GntP family permease [Peptococcaceae bacterium]